MVPLDCGILTLVSVYGTVEWELLTISVYCRELPNRLDNGIVPGVDDSSNYCISLSFLQGHYIPCLFFAIVEDSQCALVSPDLSCLDPMEAVQEQEQSDYPCSPRETRAYCQAVTVGNLNQLRWRRDQDRLYRWVWETWMVSANIRVIWVSKILAKKPEKSLANRLIEPSACLPWLEAKTTRTAGECCPTSTASHSSSHRLTCVWFQKPSYSTVSCLSYSKRPLLNLQLTCTISTRAWPWTLFRLISLVWQIAPTSFRMLLCDVGCFICTSPESHSNSTTKRSQIFCLGWRAWVSIWYQSGATRPTRCLATGVYRCVTGQSNQPNQPS